MHRVCVCYGHPADPAAFDAHYASTHAPLAAKVPGLVSYTTGKSVSLDGSPAPYYLVADLSFADEASLQAGLGSPEMAAAAADVPTFADGGVTMFLVPEESVPLP